MTLLHLLSCSPDLMRSNTQLCRISLVSIITPLHLLLPNLGSPCHQYLLFVIARRLTPFPGLKNYHSPLYGPFCVKGMPDQPRGLTAGKNGLSKLSLTPLSRSFLSSSTTKSCTPTFLTLSNPPPSPLSSSAGPRLIS